jgi:hypothetical protein
VSDRGPRRRGHTRWLIVTPMLGLALIVAGVVWLEAVHPQVPTEGRAVEGIPPLGVEDVEPCIRRAGDPQSDEIDEEFPPLGRVSSTQVFSCPQAFDRMRVTYVGEIVGEVLPRRGGAWAQINDDAYALEVGPLVGHREQSGFNTGLAVWLPDDMHEAVTGVGGPAQRGDVVLVRGVLHRTDPDDGGGTTIRADTLEILQESHEVEVPFHTVQAVAAGVLALVALGTVLWSRRQRQQ